jgi:hypothetical protein
VSSVLRGVRERILLVVALAIFAFGLVACGPEANRVDGDGKESGADVGNWGDPIQLHGNDDKDTRIYYQTPDELAVEE